MKIELGEFESYEADIVHFMREIQLEGVTLLYNINYKHKNCKQIEYKGGSDIFGEKCGVDSICYLTALDECENNIQIDNMDELLNKILIYEQQNY